MQWYGSENTAKDVSGVNMLHLWFCSSLSLHWRILSMQRAEGACSLS